MKQIFDIKRAFNLLKLYTAINKKQLIISILGFCGTIFTISFFISNFSAHPVTSLRSFYVIITNIFLFGGLIAVSSRAFQHINTPEKSLLFTSVPASTFEKYIIPFLVSSIGWFALCIVSVFLTTSLTTGLWSAIFDFKFHWFNPLDHMKMYFLNGTQGIKSSSSDFFQIYILIHSIFFLGATAFKKVPTFKTFLAGFVTNLYFTFVALITIIILFGNLETMGNRVDHLSEKITFFRDQLPVILEYTFSFILPIIFYVAAFFKLKEREL